MKKQSRNRFGNYNKKKNFKRMLLRPLVYTMNDKMNARKKENKDNMFSYGVGKIHESVPEKSSTSYNSKSEGKVYEPEKSPTEFNLQSLGKEYVSKKSPTDFNPKSEGKENVSEKSSTSYNSKSEGKESVPKNSSSDLNSGLNHLKLSLPVDNWKNDSFNISSSDNWNIFFLNIYGLDCSDSKGIVELLCRNSLYKVTLEFAFSSNKLEKLNITDVNDNEHTIDKLSIPIKTDGGDALIAIWKEGIGYVEIKDFGEYKPIIDITDNNLINKIIIYQERKIARAAIMSRNMSHNIGSHVLSYLQNDIVNDATIDLYSLISGISVSYTPQISKKINSSATISNSFINDLLKDIVEDRVISSKIEPKYAYIRGVSHLISYLQERQDYIALISTDDAPAPIAINFKNEVYDFLNPDYKGIRHNNYPATDNILLHYILNSEGIHRPTYWEQTVDKKGDINNVIIRFRSFDGINEGNSDLDLMREWDICVPAGTLGRQAFYSILENVLRNAAKHDSSQLNKVYDNLDVCKRNLEISIDYFDHSSLNNFTSSDSGLKNILEWYYKGNDKNFEYYYVTLTVNTMPNENDFAHIRKAIGEKFVDHHKMLDTNKGIKEMRISAAWLRSEEEPVDLKSLPDNDDTRDDKYFEFLDGKLPFLYVRKDNNNHLQYIFCVLKPKELAYIVKDDTTPPALPLKWGWQSFTETDYIGLKPNTFKLVIVGSDVNYPTVRACSGCRCFKITKTIEDLLNSSERNNDNIKVRKDLLNLLYRNSANVSDDEKLYIGDDKTPNIEDEAKERIEYYSTINEKANVPHSYVYHSHYNFEKFPNNALSIEAISGGNSTDSLIRHSKLNLSWFYMHLNALKSRIAIFDERIYDRMLKHPDLGLAAIDKRLHFFTIKDYLGKEKIELYRIVSEFENGKRFLKEEMFATFKWGNNELTIDCDKTFDKFDFISIHQGLFDKIYDSMIVPIGSRKQVALAIHKKMCMGAIHENINFCERMSIHSGRSKPAISSMPMDLPFIPYSAIERAVSDCKYTLVELLYNAKR